MLSVSITIGAIALTRLSPVAAVSQLVHPRLDAPVTTNDLTSKFHSFLANSWSASIAFTTLLTIGNRSGQEPSFVSRYLTKVSAMRVSSTSAPSLGLSGLGATVVSLPDLASRYSGCLGTP